MNIRIHCFQHAPFEDMGCIKDWIKKEGFPLNYTRFYEDWKIPSIDSYDWLIIMGGPMSVNDETHYPWLAEEKKAIKEAIDRGKTVLGICLGSQLIAATLGAKVTKNPEPEIGWFDVTLTDQGKQNPLFKNIENTFKIFQWHGDTFEIPAGALHLATSPVCKNQAFVFGDRVLGLQFHLEVTNESLNLMLRDADDELIDAPFIQKKEEMLKNAHYIESTNQLMYKILDRLKELQPPK
ncbi:type 1 glutamine amidotransferase [Thermophagus xiamenensis]|uniref:GMP synthase-Glutamine amidotransferase n=1 Tax=Thermophagus xiamenensis TaxID=385682 RepID=A0A1I1VYH7_9BACT|nr:type 1 glutamine amidotransferase [Thermophagus xiamenensis]SFD86083.1 GMP synthase-Glutamine amidotransferase [Thermophagus xiamenensis]